MRGSPSGSRKKRQDAKHRLGALKLGSGALLALGIYAISFA